MKRPDLSVEVPGGDPTTPQAEAMGPEPSAKSRGRFSPGNFLGTAANVLTLGMVQRSPSRAQSKAQQLAGLSARASVNPIQRAAHDASYRHSLELTEQEKQQVATFKKKPSRRRHPSEKPVRGVGAWAWEGCWRARQLQWTLRLPCCLAGLALPLRAPSRPAAPRAADAGRGPALRASQRWAGGRV